ncbi:MAG TPA: chemotaxis-specific protein-glutamate methyltransferase CheB [Gemmatimonadales bacterium]
MIRVVVAEDSHTARQLLVEILESDPEIRVVGQAANGVEAVDLTARLRPDLVAMDVHMPQLDGLEATKEIMVKAPTPIVIVSSSVSGREVELSLNAMRAGALMVMAKPDDPRSARFDGRRAELLAMVKAMAQVKVVRRWPVRATAAAAAPGARVSRPGPRASARLVAIAASTGGPAALQQILSSLPRDFGLPILVVQHMAAGFIQGLADWLGGNCNLRVTVARHGERLAPRTVYLAPDDRQLGVTAEGRIVVVDEPAVGGFRPSATYLFQSAARAAGSAVAAVILTGMGADGVAGLKDVKAAGGVVLAQDEATSVVYGMPREAVGAGVVDAVLPVEEIAGRLLALAPGAGVPTDVQDG